MRTPQKRSRGPCAAGATSGAAKLARPPGRSFGGRSRWQVHEIQRINTGMIQHPSLAADMLADIILYPTSDELRQSPDDPLVVAKARRAVTLYFNLLQAILAKNGPTVSLDRLEHDPD